MSEDKKTKMLTIWVTVDFHELLKKASENDINSRSMSQICREAIWKEIRRINNE